MIPDWKYKINSIKIFELYSQNYLRKNWDHLLSQEFPHEIATGGVDLQQGGQYQWQVGRPHICQVARLPAWVKFFLKIVQSSEVIESRDILGNGVQSLLKPRLKVV
jgi:hypothetical protein